ncbi:MAG: LysR family hydrogen peroxide-inducible transcriptional activator, partial [Cyclobacteriaceae bacterium]
MEISDRLSLKQIRYFTTIAESGSFRQAAFRLDVTQPALSNQIAILEKLLDLQLFERSKNGTTTTVEGRELLPNAKRILEEVHGFASKSR